MTNVCRHDTDDDFVCIKSVLILPDDCIVGTGSAEEGNELRVRIIKTDESGILLFEKEYGTGEYTYNTGNSIEQLSPNIYIIAASGSGYGVIINNQWAWLIATNLEGDTLWTQFINKTNTFDSDGEINSIEKIKDNLYFTGGWYVNREQEVINQDLWIFKFRVDTSITGITFEKKISEQSFFHWIITTQIHSI